MLEAFPGPFETPAYLAQWLRDSGWTQVQVQGLPGAIPECTGVCADCVAEQSKAA
jgi:hypothetical protein